VPAWGGAGVAWQATPHVSEGEKGCANISMTPLTAGQTTVVVKNLPGRYTMEDLLQLWPPDLTFDFMHAPYNLLHRRPLGFVFINFLTHELALAFQRKWHGRTSSRGRPIAVHAAEVQGRRGNLRLLAARKMGELEKAGFLPLVLKGTAWLRARAIVLETVEARDGLCAGRAEPLGAPELPGTSDVTGNSYLQARLEAKAQLLEPVFLCGRRASEAVCRVAFQAAPPAAVEARSGQRSGAAGPLGAPGSAGGARGVAEESGLDAPATALGPDVEGARPAACRGR